MHAACTLSLPPVVRPAEGNSAGFAHKLLTYTAHPAQLDASLRALWPTMFANSPSSTFTFCPPYPHLTSIRFYDLIYIVRFGACMLF